MWLYTLIGAGVAMAGLAYWQRRNIYRLLDRFILNPEALGSPDMEGSVKEMDADLLKKLKALAKDWGKKIKVNSGFRTEAHNTAVGGAQSSAHKKGLAVDVGGFRDKWEALEFARLARKHDFRRIGVANTMVHLDIDHQLPTPAYWAERYGSFSDNYVANELKKVA